MTDEGIKPVKIHGRPRQSQEAQVFCSKMIKEFIKSMKIQKFVTRAPKTQEVFEQITHPKLAQPRRNTLSK